MKKYELAEGSLIKAIEINPNLAKAYQGLGLVQQDLKRYD